jgi:hypothetical protein
MLGAQPFDEDPGLRGMHDDRDFRVTAVGNRFDLENRPGLRPDNVTYVCCEIFPPEPGRHSGRLPILTVQQAAASGLLHTVAFYL